MPSRFNSYNFFWFLLLDGRKRVLIQYCHNHYCTRFVAYYLLIQRQNERRNYLIEHEFQKNSIVLLCCTRFILRRIWDLIEDRQNLVNKYLALLKHGSVILFKKNSSMKSIVLFMKGQLQLGSICHECHLKTRIKFSR